MTLWRTALGINIFAFLMNGLFLSFGLGRPHIMLICVIINALCILGLLSVRPHLE